MSAISQIRFGDFLLKSPGKGPYVKTDLTGLNPKDPSTVFLTGQHAKPLMAKKTNSANGKREVADLLRTAPKNIFVAPTRIGPQNIQHFQVYA